MFFCFFYKNKCDYLDFILEELLFLARLRLMI